MCRPAEGYGAAVRAGLGWGMYPEQLAEAALADGCFVRISDVHVDVPLFWQCWKLDSLIIANYRHCEVGRCRSAPTPTQDFLA